MEQEERMEKDIKVSEERMEEDIKVQEERMEEDIKVQEERMEEDNKAGGEDGGGYQGRRRKKNYKSKNKIISVGNTDITKMSRYLYSRRLKEQLLNFSHTNNLRKVFFQGGITRSRKRVYQPVVMVGCEGGWGFRSPRGMTNRRYFHIDTRHNADPLRMCPYK